MESKTSNILIDSLELKNFSVQFPGQNSVLNGCNLRLEAGKTYLMTGTTGSGKSTLMRFLKGIIPLFYPALITGEVNLNGKSISLEQLWELRTEIGYLFQDPTLQVVGSTVEQDLAFGLENLALPSRTIKQEIQRLATSLGIKHLLHRVSSELSGGELSLVALCSILILNPQIVLLDEFTAFLDSLSRQRVLKIIEAIKTSSRIIVIVSHQIQEILPVVDEVYFLDQGQIIVHSSSSEFIATNFSKIASNLKISDFYRVGIPLCEKFNLKSNFLSVEDLLQNFRGT